MKLLYYRWEQSDKDILDTLSLIGHSVTAIQDPGFMGAESDTLYAAVLSKLADGFDAVFTMDYFPAVSRACREKDVLYISWIWDCPHLTLYSKTAKNPCNRIFSFDLFQTKELLARGIQAKYMPLAVNTDRLERLIASSPWEKEAPNVSFVGSLKQEEGKEGLLGQIKAMPEDLRGYIDGIIEAQLLIHGYDLIGECLTRERLLELVRCAPVMDPEDYETDIAGLYADWIRKKTTILERRRLLEAVAGRYSLTLASPENPGFSGIDYLGYVNYETEMPLIFSRSRINLNLTMRTIRHGIPLRVLDVLGAGGFLITNYQPDFDNYFANGKELVWFESKEHLLELIDYYLKNEEERQRIAAAGRRRAAQIFNYPSILKEIFAQV